MVDFDGRGAYDAPRLSFLGVVTLEPELLNRAKERVPCIPVLINMVSRRVRQLNSGLRPLVNLRDPNEDRLEIALREIAEGKLTAEIDFGMSDAGEENAG